MRPSFCRCCFSSDLPAITGEGAHATGDQKRRGLLLLPPFQPNPTISLTLTPSLHSLSLSFHPQRPTNPSRPPTLRQQAVLNWERRHQRPLVVEDGHRQQEIVVVHLRGGGWEPGEGAHTCQHLCKGGGWRRNKLLSTCGAERRAIPCSRRTEAGPCCGGGIIYCTPYFSQSTALRAMHTLIRTAICLWRTPPLQSPPHEPAGACPPANYRQPTHLCHILARHDDRRLVAWVLQRGRT